MNFNISRFLLIAALSSGFALSACGDDEDTEETDGEGTDGEGTDGEGNANEGACLNDADGAILADESIDASAVAGDCALGTNGIEDRCLGAEDPLACSTMCVARETGLTEDCATCYGATVDCSIQNCIAECSADPSGDACRTCQVEAGCTTEFYSCTGLTPPEDTTEAAAE